MGAFFLQNLRILRLVSTLQFLHIEIHSLICTTLAAVCGTRLTLKNHATVVIEHAWAFAKTVPNFRFQHMASTCALDAPCYVTVDLNRVNACHRELFPQTNGDSVSHKMADDQFPKGFVVFQKRRFA